MNKIIYTTLVSISILTLLIILFACLPNILNNVYAPQFGGHPPSPKHSFSEPLTGHSKPLTGHSEPLTRLSEPIKIEKNTLKHSIEKKFLVKPTEPREMREIKIKEILHSLDTKTQPLDKQLKNEIWGDAYTFANTVLVPFMGKVVVKFLLYLHF